MYGCLVCGCTENETAASSYRGANFSLLLFTLACGFTCRCRVATHITKPTYEKQQKELMSLSYLKTLWPKNNILQNNLCKWSASNLNCVESSSIKSRTNETVWICSKKEKPWKMQMHILDKACKAPKCVTTRWWFHLGIAQGRRPIMDGERNLGKCICTYYTFLACKHTHL
jgi:hypothetical protein